MKTGVSIQTMTSKLFSHKKITLDKITTQSIETVETETRQQNH